MPCCSRWILTIAMNRTVATLSFVVGAFSNIQVQRCGSKVFGPANLLVDAGPRRHLLDTL